MDKEYKYLVSYHHKGGLGTATLTRPKMISDYSDIAEVARAIEVDGGVHRVGIINFILLNDPPEKTMGWREALQVIVDTCLSSECDTCEMTDWCEDITYKSTVVPYEWSIPKPPKEEDHAE